MFAKKKIFVLVGCIFGASISVAQTSDEITLDELTSPNSPAFTIIGLNPTEVNRPTSTRTLVLSFANSLENTKGLGSDLAIEFSPYWFAKHKELTFDKYFHEIKLDTLKFGQFLKHIATNAVQTSSFSFATSQVKDDTLNGRNVSMGIKFQLLSGKPSKEFKDAHNAITTNDDDDWIVEELNSLTGISGNNIGDKIDSLCFSRVNFDLKYKSFTEKQKQIEAKKISERVKLCFSGDVKKYSNDKLKDLIVIVSKHYDSIQKRNIEKFKKAYISSRYGWIWDVAFASSLILPTNEIDYSIGNNWGMWTTLTYRTENQKNDFNLMVRRMGNYNKLGTYNTDFGVSYILSGKKYNISFEGLLRNYQTQFLIQATTGESYLITKNKYTNRFTFSLQYKLQDYINVTASVGKDYDNNYTTGGNLFSLININLLLPEKQNISLK
jgi:hypothetical protein